MAHIGTDTAFTIIDVMRDAADSIEGHGANLELATRLRSLAHTLHQQLDPHCTCNDCLGCNCDACQTGDGH